MLSEWHAHACWRAWDVTMMLRRSSVTGEEVPVSGGMRYLWPRALKQARRQQALLKTALTERAGDSSQAGLFWRKAFDQTRAPNSLGESRQAFSAWLELARLPPEEMTWRKRVIQQRLEKGRQELLKMNTAGNPDVLFFRAAVFTDFEPILAARDIKTLLQRRPWVEKELRIGGGRILWLADAALKIGQFELAQRAYDLLEKERLSCGEPGERFGEPGERFGKPDQLLAKRRALVSLYEAIVSDEFQSMDYQSRDLQGEAALVGTVCVPQRLDLAFSEVVKAWAGHNLQEPCLMAMLGSLLCGYRDFTTYLTRARQGGVEDEIYLALDSLASGRISPNLSIESLNQFPQAVRPLLIFCCGQALEAERIRTFLEWAGHDWLSLSPVAPQRIAAQVVQNYVRQGGTQTVLQKYEQALSWVRTNLSSMKSEQWVVELESWIHLHQALWLGKQGELGSAVQEMRRAETILRSFDSVRKG